MEIPKLLLDTDAFFGVGYGNKGEYYRSHFYHKPSNMTRIIDTAIEYGIEGIHVIAKTPIISAVRQCSRDLKVVGTIGTKDFDKELEKISILHPEALLLPGSLTDLIGVHSLSALCARIERVSAPGVVTHNPGSTIPILENIDRIKVVMAPLNPVGRFMEPNKRSALDAIQKSSKFIIGKRILEGVQSYDEAFNYAMGMVHSVAVRMVSEQEILKCTQAALKHGFM